MVMNFKKIIDDLKGQQYYIQEQDSSFNSYKKKMEKANWKDKINNYVDSLTDNTFSNKLEFDSMKTLTYNGSAEVGTVLLENGAFKTNNYKRENPSNINCQAVISRVGNIARLITQYNIIYKFLKLLDKWKKDTILIEIRTKANTYKNYTLIDYSLPESFDNFNLFEVNMSFQQVLLNKQEERVEKRSFSKTTLALGVLFLTTTLIK